MGLTTEQFLAMDLWQYNAYSQAWKSRMHDALAIELQGAWMAAYWNSSKKHKISLEKVLKKLETKKQVERKPVDMKEVESAFRQFEEIQKYGWTKV